VWSSELAPAGCAEALAVVSFTRRLLFVDGVNDQQQDPRTGPGVPCRLCYRSGVRSAPLLRGPPIGSFEPSYARLNAQLGVSEL
jgi:hypothetical protein